MSTADWRFERWHRSKRLFFTFFLHYFSIKMESFTCSTKCYTFFLKTPPSTLLSTQCLSLRCEEHYSKYLHKWSNIICISLNEQWWKELIHFICSKTLHDGASNDFVNQHASNSIRFNFAKFNSFTSIDESNENAGIHSKIYSSNHEAHLKHI